MIVGSARGGGAGTTPAPALTLPALARRAGFPREVRAHATAVACSLPRQHAQPITRWRAAELQRQVWDALEACTISPSTVRRWLRAACIRPWRYHAWHHIPDPQTFLERARPVLALYARAQAVLAEGTWVVCGDEQTAIQARAGEEAPRGAQAGQPVVVAARYRRRGARHLFAALRVADGTVSGQCHEAQALRGRSSTAAGGGAAGS